jgi:RimJ/RimL family protein N-acetyltransferase
MHASIRRTCGWVKFLGSRAKWLWHHPAVTEPRVHLRDVTLADADLLDAWQQDGERSEFNDFGVPFEPTPRDVLANGPLRNDRNGVLIIQRVDSGVPIGTVGWHKVGYGPGTASDAWNFGIELRPEARGQGFGTEAQRQLADWLFANTSVNRVEASTDVENVAEQRSLEKAGYVREGIQRGAQFRAGAYHDLVTYSRLRTDR